MPFLGKSGTSRISFFSWSQFMVPTSTFTTLLQFEMTINSRLRLDPQTLRHHPHAMLAVPRASATVNLQSGRSSTHAPSLLHFRQNCLRTQPAIPRMCASRSTNQRKPTPCTRPRTRKRAADLRSATHRISSNESQIARSRGKRMQPASGLDYVYNLTGSKLDLALRPRQDRSLPRCQP